MKNELDKMFEVLLGESKQHRKKEERRKKKAKTMGEARKAREQKVISNIMRVKHQIGEARDKIMLGKLERSFILATVQHETCTKCRKNSPRVASMQVWSRATSGDTTRTEPTTNILSKGMYEFHSDLPIKMKHVDSTIAACPECLFADCVRREKFEAKAP